jgi:signal transduction histidine kinase
MELMSGRTVLSAAIVNLPDAAADPHYDPRSVTTGHWRRMLGVPIMLEGRVLGALVVCWRAPGETPQQQIDLLQTFADQAVIAIENTRLFEAEQASKRELSESLSHQTATAEILACISGSLIDTQPVFEAIVRNLRLLFGSRFAVVQILQGDTIHMPAVDGEAGFERLIDRFPRPLDNTTVGGQVMLSKQTVQFSKLQDNPSAPPAAQNLGREFGYDSAIFAPMVLGDRVIGAIGAAHPEPREFTDKQIALIEAFADQAVIAIENTRLFQEVQARTRELAKTVEHLEIASQHKSQFVANMSHELRTPLAAILGYAELMQEGFYGTPSEKSMDALSRIRSNGNHLLGLINTVLDIAKIESGQFSLNLAEYALSSVVETVRAATESLAETKKIALMTYVPRSLPVGFGDEQRLTQVLLNLVGNAIKFTDAGEVRITARAENSHFAVSVADTGPGIPPDQLTRVFEQFHQVDASNTKAKGGTGLGLAIAKQIVEMHGGRVWVESEVGKGATFLMQLPVRAESRKALQ